MKVAIISPIDPDIILKPGGTRSYILNLIRVFAEKGIKTTLVGISLDKRGNFSNSLFTFIPIARGSNVSGYKFLFNLLLKVRSLKLQKSSIIHIQRPDQMLPLVIFYRKNPKICTLHGIGYSDVYFKKGKFIGEIYRLVERFALKRADCIIVVDENTEKFYTKKYPWLKDKIVVIPIGIDTKLFKPMEKHEMREKYGFKEEDKIIIYVGRLEKEKALDLLMNVFKEVKEEIKNAKLVLVGAGRERRRLENLVNELKLRDVIFIGALEHNKIPEIINCADVFALTSLHESGPLVTQEALACGISVVTTDVGRVRDFIKNDVVGRIVDRNEKKFAVAIKEMLNMDQEKTRNACRKVAMDFSFEKTANKTIEAYKILNTICNKN